jgi:hypothetical protein
MFIQRKHWDISDREAWEIDCKPYMGKLEGATPLYSDDGTVVGWMVKGMYE